MPSLMASHLLEKRRAWDAGMTPDGSKLEAWSLGWLFCGIVIMLMTTLANMSNRLLHKLILLELFLALLRGTALFVDFPGRSYYQSAVSFLIFASYFLHNIIAWLKVKPFLRPAYGIVFMGTLMLTLPYWILATYAHFEFFNKGNPLFKKTRPLEAIFRDPWWIFSCVNLVWNIKRRYHYDLIPLVRTCPRFGIMLFAMVASLAFACADIATTVHPAITGVAGTNPFWKLSMIFKCYTDTVILDDFKTALDNLRSSAFNRSSVSAGSRNVSDSSRPSLKRSLASWTSKRGFSADESVTLGSLSSKAGTHTRITSIDRRGSHGKVLSKPESVDSLDSKDLKSVIYVKRTIDVDEEERELRR